MKNEMIVCACCQQWFTYNGQNAIVVKHRGMKPRYYCGLCIKEHQILQNQRKGEIAK